MAVFGQTILKAETVDDIGKSSKINVITVFTNFKNSFISGKRYCVCGTIDYEGHVEHLDESLANLVNSKSSEDMCKPMSESEPFHKDVLHCDTIANANGTTNHVCKLSSCYTNGYCFKWLHKDGGMITTTYG